jgi:hypothetical protein
LISAAKKSGADARRFRGAQQRMAKRSADLNYANYLMAARQQVRFADFGRKLLTRCDHETHLLWEGQVKLAEIRPGYNVNVATICGSR